MCKYSFEQFEADVASPDFLKLQHRHSVDDEDSSVEGVFIGLGVWFSSHLQSWKTIRVYTIRTCTLYITHATCSLLMKESKAPL